MSSSKQVTLSRVHNLFHRLQDHLKRILSALPESAPPALQDGLIRAHLKLSDYHTYFDASPYYIWSCFLDPRINYEGLLAEARKDTNEISRAQYIEQIELAKQQLRIYFLDHYSSQPCNPSQESAIKNTPSKYNFDDDEPMDILPTEELDDYLKNRPLGFKRSAHALDWWRTNAQKYPNVARFARDILAIPGSAVAVERVFSGGRDTVSLRRASLKPETIRKLMLVKHRLLLARRMLAQTGRELESAFS